MTTTSRYEIEQTATGVLLGEYEASSPREAIQAMLRDAGDEGPADPGLVARRVVTNRQVRRLQTEAGEAGDLEMVRLCRVACGEEEATPTERRAARIRCAEAIDAARTMGD